MNLSTLYSKHKQENLFGRYIPPEKIEPLLFYYQSKFEIKDIGSSEKGRKIHSIKLGSGEFKIFIWSQMHGNESTTTKAIFDLIQFLSTKGDLQTQILNHFTLLIIPMLNPDGSRLYTRVNANSVDLNRDAKTQTQKESKALMDSYKSFKPDLCLNMHDQRTIFSVGDTNKSAIVSFLAPAADESKTITPARIFAMQAIAAIQSILEEFIPGHISRFDDTFNENCIGDTFQSMQTPTILFEAGHVPGDYQREKTREYIFYALLTLIMHIKDDKVKSLFCEDYFKIPESRKNLRDIVISNLSLPDKAVKTNIGIQFKEILEEDKIELMPFIDFISENTNIRGHLEIDASVKNVLINSTNKIHEGQEVSDLKINSKKII
tara:strand:- start:90443 stop:91573 length:1131 start_codon:yes stop_codon:yes gene_type:complete